MPKQVYEVTVCENGDEYWKLDGNLHRDGDLPAIICSDGSKYWYQHGKIYRDGDLPSGIRSDGARVWYQHGFPHRLTGPAIEHPNGDVEYHIEGKRLSKEEFLLRTQPAKKMTVSEIEKKLGHRVEVIAEESQGG